MKKRNRKEKESIDSTRREEGHGESVHRMRVRVAVMMPTTESLKPFSLDWIGASHVLADEPVNPTGVKIERGEREERKKVGKEEDAKRGRETRKRNEKE